MMTSTGKVCGEHTAPAGQPPTGEQPPPEFLIPFGVAVQPSGEFTLLRSREEITPRLSIYGYELSYNYLEAELRQSLTGFRLTMSIQNPRTTPMREWEPSDSEENEYINPW